MSANWKTVRVFISSTFRDMQAERDHLVRFVFPRLREELLPRRIHLVDVDLRWGVTTDQDALDVMREAIDECRPWFLCMIGGRYGWVPPGRECSILEDEIRYGVLDRLEGHRYPLVYFRDPNVTSSIPSERLHEFSEPPESPNEEKLVRLKESIFTAGITPRVYNALWDEQEGRFAHLEHFGEQVFTDLLASIDREFGPASVLEVEPFAQERAATESLLQKLTEIYVDRQYLTDALKSFVSSHDQTTSVVVTGPEGSGKSALLAKLCCDLLSESAPCITIPCFIDAATGSTELRMLLRRTCFDLARSAGLTVEIPDDVVGLSQALGNLLFEAARRNRVVLLFDGLNQLESTDDAHDLHWLPRNLPSNVRLIISCSSDGLTERLRSICQPLLELAVPPLSRSEASAVIEVALARFHKRMTPEQKNVLLAKFDSGNPLYLRVAVDELRKEGVDSYEQLTRKIADLPQTVSELFRWILTRLEHDPGLRNHLGQLVGHQLLAKVGSYLLVSRSGLSEPELADLVGRQSDTERNVPALIELLRPHLFQNGTLLQFHRAQFRSAAEAMYLANEEGRIAAHRDLALYFSRQPVLLDHGSTRTPNMRLISEWHPQHARLGHASELWVTTMTAFEFLATVVEHFDVRKGSEDNGKPIAWHQGYYVVGDELNAWLDAYPSVPAAHELIEPLRQVWSNHDEFVETPGLLMPVLYHSLMALEKTKPKKTRDRRSQRVIFQGGAIWAWCERERLKHENPDSPWSVIASKPAIFISYRRDGGEHLAGRVRDALKNRGFSVFMDVEDLKSGKFDEALLGIIEGATDVIVILTPGCFDRCRNDDDWFRREIRHAISCNRNVVPIIARGFQMPLSEALPSDIADLPKYNGLTPAHELFDASIDRLISTFLKASKLE